MKAEFIWKFRMINVYIKKRIQINNLNVHLKEIGKKGKINPKLKRNGVRWLPYAAHKNFLKIEQRHKCKNQNL